VSEWFDSRRGLRFKCTMCGACCSGPPGYVLVSDAEVVALAARLGLGRDEFVARYTQETIKGRSLIEKQSEHGYDCVFLDRESVPGHAVCGVYEDRPAQCVSWPFWRSNVRSEEAWRRAGGVCPGLGKGKLYPPEYIRIKRARVDI